MIYIYYFWYNIAWSGMLVGYTVEILPYNIRAKGLTVMFLMVDIALFFNQYVNPIALDCKHPSSTQTIFELETNKAISNPMEVLHLLLRLARMRTRSRLLLLRRNP